MSTLIHSGVVSFPTPLELEQAVLRVPEATIVFGHMGAYFHGSGCDLVVAERREYVVLGKPPACPYPELIGEAVRRIGAERVIFGSDGPGCPPAIELDKVRA